MYKIIWKFPPKLPNDRLTDGAKKTHLPGLDVVFVVFRVPGGTIEDVPAFENMQGAFRGYKSKRIHITLSQL